MQTPHFWKREDKDKILRDLTQIKDRIEEFEAIASLVASVKTHEDAERTAQRIETLKEQALFRDRYDVSDAILSIYAGAGGDDAEDWVTVLARMYQRHATKKGFTVEVLHRHENEHGGFKNITMKIQGENAYGYFKKESGVHRLVRISPFSAAKLRHTSFALVEVLPVLPETDVAIDEKDIKVEFARSSGPGGQNVNKRETSVRVIHIPTGITVVSQTQRSQYQNRENAMQILRAKLFRMMEEHKVKEIKELKGRKVEISWGNQIRSYVMHPYQLVKDNRTGVETKKLNEVLNGGIDEFIAAELKMQNEK